MTTGKTVAMSLVLRLSFSAILVAALILCVLCFIAACKAVSALSQATRKVTAITVRRPFAR